MSHMTSIEEGKFYDSLLASDDPKATLESILKKMDKEIESSKEEVKETHGLIVVSFYSLGREDPDDFIDCLKKSISSPLKCAGYVYEKEHCDRTGNLKGNTYKIYYKGLKSRFNEAREICEKYHFNVDRVTDFMTIPYDN